MPKEIKDLLVLYLKSKINKEELIKNLETKNISAQEFNAYVLNIIKSNSKIEQKGLASQRKRNVLEVKKLLDTQFIAEIKKAKPTLEEVNFKLSKDEIRKRLLMDPRLNVYFEVRKANVFDQKEIFFRLKKYCIEYGLDVKNEQVSKLIFDSLNLFIKNFITEKNGELLEDDQIKEKILKYFPVLNCLKNPYQ